VLTSGTSNGAGPQGARILRRAFNEGRHEPGRGIERDLNSALRALIYCKFNEL